MSGSNRHIGRRDFLAASGVLVAAPAIVRAQGRNGVALVIGNSRYRWEASLPNVGRDAPDIARRFEQLGLKTELLQDLDGNALRGTLERFGGSARGARLAAFYFAGHGVFWEKQSYVVPTDADLSNPSVAQSLVPVPSVGAALKDASARLLVFDSCRNNPADGWRQRQARALAREDAAMSAANALQQPNTLLLFSTAPGSIALDGPAGQNSPFAAALLRQLAASSFDLLSLPEVLRRDLLLATECRQMVWDQSTFTASLSIPGAGGSAGPRYDAARVVELPKAYAFAQQNGLLLPRGLVAIRPAQETVGPRRVGSFRYEAPVRGGAGFRSQGVVIVLSVPAPNAAEVVQSFTHFGGVGGKRWRNITANNGDGISWLSVDEQQTLELKWRDNDAGTYSASPRGNRPNEKIVVEPFARLDG